MNQAIDLLLQQYAWRNTLRNRNIILMGEIAKRLNNEAREENRAREAGSAEQAPASNS